MLKYILKFNFISSLVLLSLVTNAIASNGQDAIKSAQLSPFMESKKSCVSKSNVKFTKELKEKECLTNEASPFFDEGQDFRALMSVMVFQNEDILLGKGKINQNFYRGARKSCLSCAGISEREYNKAEEMLIDEVNKQRHNYAVQMYIDLIVNNTVSSGKDKLKYKYMCENEIQKLEQSDCSEKFKKIISGSRDFKDDRKKNSRVSKRMLKNQKKNKGIVPKTFISNMAKTFNGDGFIGRVDTMYSEDSNMYNGNDLYLEDEANQKSNLTQNSSSFLTGEVDFNSTDRHTVKQFKTNLATLKKGFKKAERNIADELFKIKRADFKIYCNSSTKAIIDVVAKDFVFLNSYRSYEGRLNKNWICSNFDTDEEKFKDPKQILKTLPSIRGDSLKEEIAVNCSEKFKVLTETFCADKQSIGSDAFYNKYSDGHKAPIESLLGDDSTLSKSEKLGLRAVACIYNDELRLAMHKREQYLNGLGYKKNSVRTRPYSIAQGRLIDRSIAGRTTLNDNIANGEKKSSVENKKLKNKEENNTFDDFGSKAFSNNSELQNENNFNNNPYNPISNTPSVVSDKEDTSSNQESKDADNDKISKLNDEILMLMQRNETLKKKIEVASSSEERRQLMDEQSIKEKELEELQRKVKELKKQKTMKTITESEDKKTLSNENKSVQNGPRVVASNSNYKEEAIGRSVQVASILSSVQNNIDESEPESTARKLNYIQNNVSGLRVSTKNSIGLLLEQGLATREDYEKFSDAIQERIEKFGLEKDLKLYINQNGQEVVQVYGSSKEVLLSELKPTVQELIRDSLALDRSPASVELEDINKRNVINFETEEENAENKSFYDAYSGARE